jgi:Fe-S-cluster-containing dehydrogenase component
MKEQAILVDTTHCTGCNSCSYRCIQEFGDHEVAARGMFRNIVLIKDQGIVRQQCMNCRDAQCVKASEGALTKSAYGPVLVDDSKLKNAKAVTEACPFHAAHYDETSKKLVNCNLCAHRLVEGKQPACVDACPAGALQSGDYEQMSALAKQLAASKHLKVYGLNENGGTHVIILTKVDPVGLGYPKVKGSLRAELTTELSAGPLVAGVLYAGFKKYSERRTAVEQTENKKAE